MNPEALLAHADFVRALARSLVRDESAAEDVAQDALAASLTASKGGLPRPLQQARAWLAVVTRNVARQRARAESRRSAREAAVARRERVPSAEDIARREAIRAELVRAVLDLPEALQEVVLLRYYEGLAPRAIAARLELPIETVRTRLKRGLTRMRGRLARSESAAEYGGLAALAPLAGFGGSSTPAGVSATALPWLWAGAWAKWAAGMLVVAAGVVTWRWWGASPPPTEAALGAPAPQLARAPDVDAPGDAPARSVAQALPSAPVPANVRGRVLAPDGQGVARALVYASPNGPSDGPRDVQGGTAENERAPVWSKSDDQGAFTLEVARPGRVFVAAFTAGSDPFLAPGEGRWVEAPASDVALTLQELPWAGLELTALTPDGVLLRDLHVTSWSSLTHTYLPLTGTGTKLSARLPLAAGIDRAEFTLTLEVAGFAPWSRTVELVRERITPVEARLAGHARVLGRVVDEHGNAVAGALVYFGAMERLRGDEPFKPFNESRVKDGARSGPDGWFELEGSGLFVSAWRADMGFASAPASEAGELVLPSPGAIRGRVVDVFGAAVADARVALDRGNPVPTDALGRFEFPRVVAGARGLEVRSAAFDGPRRYGVRVASGETVEVELGSGELDVRFDLSALPAELLPRAAPPAAPPLFAMSMGPITTFSELALSDRIATASHLLPGPTLILGARGPLARVDVAGPQVAVPAAGGVVHVTGPAGASVALVPHDADELARLLCVRFSGVRLTSSGEWTFASVPAGRWRLEASVLAHAIDLSVGDEPLEVNLNP